MRRQYQKEQKGLVAETQLASARGGSAREPHAPQCGGLQGEFATPTMRNIAIAPKQKHRATIDGWVCQARAGTRMGLIEYKIQRYQDTGISRSPPKKETSPPNSAKSNGETSAPASSRHCCRDRISEQSDNATMRSPARSRVRGRPCGKILKS